MTRDEALAKWTHCRQCSHWKGNFTPDENDGLMSRKLMPRVYEQAVIEEVETAGMWPSAQYTAVVRVFLPSEKIGQGAAQVTKPEKHLLYLAVR